MATYHKVKTCPQCSVIELGKLSGQKDLVWVSLVCSLWIGVVVKNYRRSQWYLGPIGLGSAPIEVVPSEERDSVLSVGLGSCDLGVLLEEYNPLSALFCLRVLFCKYGQLLSYLGPAGLRYGSSESALMEESAIFARNGLPLWLGSGDLIWV